LPEQINKKQMENLKEFMLIFRMTPSETELTPEQLGQQHQQWGAFIGGIAAQAKFMGTNRLAFEGNLIHGTTETNQITDGKTPIVSGYLLLKAETLSEATKMAKGCPIIAADGSVEIREIIPM
jgi:hypothetical protein